MPPDDTRPDGPAPPGQPKFKVDVPRGTVGAIGDHAQVYVGPVTQVSGRTPRSPESLIRVKAFEETVRARTATFVGRRFMFEAIDAAMADPGFPSGYVIVDGEPGIGKTALLSKLIVDRGYIHHLNSIGLGIRSNDEFLNDICAQLIVRYKLDQTIPERMSKDAGFLSALLTDVAKETRNLPLVIAVDALDEVQDKDGLLLPPSLPKGVFFVMTTRTGHRTRINVDQSKAIHLRDDDRRNLRDVRSFVVSRVRDNRTVMLQRVGDWGVSVCEFVRVLTRRSEGNFMYLSHVLDDVKSGALSKDTLDDVNKLPKGLNNYYARHWSVMRSGDEQLFLHYQEPVICFLTTALEPVSIEDLLPWTQSRWLALFGSRKLHQPSKLQDVVDDWMEFLNVDDPDAVTPRYRVYHASLRDWIAKKVRLSVYHDAISTAALAKISGY